ncbi:8686_t:CDS:1, partial [Racocetra fulgida]
KIALELKEVRKNKRQSQESLEDNIEMYGEEEATKVFLDLLRP